jgi:hypothetical protein
MKLEQIETLAKQELDNIFLHATKAEIIKLQDAVKEDMINGDSTTDCIYGTMTDSCYSDRAAELIQKCCPGPFVTRLTPNYANAETIEDIAIDELLGATWTRNFSPLELLLCHQPKKVISWIPL